MPIDADHCWKESNIYSGMFTLHNAEGLYLAGILRVGGSWTVYVAGLDPPQAVELDKESAMHIAEQLVYAYARAEAR
ncbi:MAG TPA: hypothetical protein VH601_16695 [Bryobacteraceae bacterium]|jgi:hypothetical protein